MILELWQICLDILDDCECISTAYMYALPNGCEPWEITLGNLSPGAAREVVNVVHDTQTKFCIYKNRGNVSEGLGTK